MSIKLKPIRLAATFLLCAPALFSASALFSTSAWAVDLVGVHDLAAQNDPRLKAAASRRDATGENRAIARANLLPQIGGGAAWSRCGSAASPSPWRC